MCYVAEGIWNKGYAVGENKMAELISYLLSNNMSEELQIALSDEDAREEMYEKYRIDKSTEVDSNMKAVSV